LFLQPACFLLESWRQGHDLRKEEQMSPALLTAMAVVFILMFVLIAWLKYREHLHMHRREHGPHSSRTDLLHRFLHHEEKH
jgi:hypothetical protein